MNLYEFHSKPEELNGYEERVYHVPVLALSALFQFSNRKDKDKLEWCISKDAKASFRYTSVTGERFKIGEDAIASDPYYSFYYARNVLKGSFPAGEEAMKHTSYWNQYQNFLERLK